MIFESLDDAFHKISLDDPAIKDVSFSDKITFDIPSAMTLAKSLLRNHHIETLNLRGLGIDDDLIDQILKGANPSLKKLNLSRNNISADGVAKIAETSSLTHLNLADNHIGNQGVQNLLGLQNPESIDISRNGLTFAAKKSLFTLIENNSSLQELILEGNNLSPKILEEILDQLQKRPKLAQAASAKQLGEQFKAVTLS